MLLTVYYIAHKKETRTRILLSYSVLMALLKTTNNLESISTEIVSITRLKL